MGGCRLRLIVAFLAAATAALDDGSCASLPADLARVPATELAALYGSRGAVSVRGRANLPSATSALLPVSIGAPRDPAFPLALRAAGARNASAWGDAARAFLDAAVPRHGAVLLRGLGLATPADFSNFTAALGWDRVVFGGGGTARTTRAAGVRTASDEPATHTIEPHQDMAHSPAHPGRIAFFMLAGPPPGAGGETVLVDMRAVTRRAERRGARAAFAAKGGVRYAKRLWSAETVDAATNTFTWQRRFFAETRADVDAALDAQPGETTWAWDADGTLDYANVLPATATHPATGETVWFNGIHTNHRDYFDLAPHIDTARGSPYDTTYGDGDPIDPATLDAIRGDIWHSAVAVGLQSGDVVVVDNLLAAHGRVAWDPAVDRTMLLAHFR